MLSNHVFLFTPGDRDAADLLISRGAKVDRADAMGMLPIHFAAWSGSVDVSNRKKLKDLYSNIKREQTSNCIVSSLLRRSSRCYFSEGGELR